MFGRLTLTTLGLWIVLTVTCATPQARADVEPLMSSLASVFNASQPGLLPDHAILASGCWPTLPGGIIYPLGSTVRFSVS